MTVQSFVELLHTFSPDAPITIGTITELVEGKAASISHKKIEVGEFSGIVVLSSSKKEENENISSITKERFISKFKED